MTQKQKNGKKYPYSMLEPTQTNKQTSDINIKLLEQTHKQTLAYLNIY